MTLDLTLEQPPDWMRFTSTRHVSWAEIETIAHSHSEAIASEFDLLVAILRAGAPIAALIARHTGLPVDYLVCNRRNPIPHFLDGLTRAPRGRRILLVDDVCGSGWTFERARRYCEVLDNSVGCFSVFRCAGAGMYVPDYGLEMDASTYLRWPWEYQDESEMPGMTRLGNGEQSQGATQCRPDTELSFDL